MKLFSWMPPRLAAWIYTVLLKPAPIRAVAHRVICRLIPEEIAVGGVTLVLNQNDAIVSGNLALGCYETYNLEIFEKLVHPGMCVIDVGANIGLYSAVAAKKVGPHGKVVAIEPDGVNCSFLKRTKDRNGLDNLVIIQKAAGAASGPAKLHLCSTNKADHRTYGGDDGRITVDIEMTTLDNVVEELGLPPVDILKIDTQGFEYYVARSMDLLLSRSRNVKILMEFWPWGISRAGGSPSQLLEFFSSRGFRIAVLDDGRKELEWLDQFDSILGLTLERQHADLYLERMPG